MPSLGKQDGSGEGVTDGPETKPRDAEIARKGGGGATGPEADEVLIVVVDEEEDGGYSDQDLGGMGTEEVDEKDEGEGEDEDGGCVEGDGDGPLVERVQRRRGGLRVVGGQCGLASDAVRREDDVLELSGGKGVGHG